jgi:hypothetical protein
LSLSFVGAFLFQIKKFILFILSAIFSYLGYCLLFVGLQVFLIRNMIMRAIETAIIITVLLAFFIENRKRLNGLNNFRLQK